jgi:hypothetical protein
MKTTSLFIVLFVIVASTAYLSSNTACKKEAVIKAGSKMSLGRAVVESQEDHLILVCDTQPEKGLLNFILKKDGVRVNGMAKEADIHYVSFNAD